MPLDENTSAAAPPGPPAPTLKRIGWLDSARMPSKVHGTLNDGVSTLCGWAPIESATVAKTFIHGKEVPRWVLVPEVPRKDHGRSRYCKTCFAEGNKSAPWLEVPSTAAPGTRIDGLLRP